MAAKVRATMHNGRTRASLLDEFTALQKTKNRLEAALMRLKEVLLPIQKLLQSSQVFASAPHGRFSMTSCWMPTTHRHMTQFVCWKNGFNLYCGKSLICVLPHSVIINLNRGTAM